MRGRTERRCDGLIFMGLRRNGSQRSLFAEGLSILARRFVVRGGEIDLVVRRGHTIAFVEVKARADLDVAASAISATKRWRLGARAGGDAKPMGVQATAATAGVRRPAASPAQPDAYRARTAPEIPGYRTPPALTGSKIRFQLCVDTTLGIATKRCGGEDRRRRPVGPRSESPDRNQLAFGTSSGLTT